MKFTFLKFILISDGESRSFPETVLRLIGVKKLGQQFMNVSFRK